jgi:hypothetical protein
MRSRSNSASVPKKWTISLPPGVVVAWCVQLACLGLPEGLAVPIVDVAS